MGRPNNRSLGIALRRLRLIVIICCWVIALGLSIQVIIWSLSSFTGLRYTEVTPEHAEQIVRNEGKEVRRGFINPRQPRDREEQKVPMIPSKADGVFGAVFSVAHTGGLLGAVVLVPLIGMGVLLGVPAGAPNVDRAVTSMAVATVLVMLALPLGGWFGLGWGEGTLASYERLTTIVDGVHENGFTFRFWFQFLVLPAASVVLFALVGMRFTAALDAVILRSGVEGIDPELEREASNIRASSLHGTGRTAGALKQAMKKSQPPKKTAAKSSPSPTEAPRRLI